MERLKSHYLDKIIDVKKINNVTIPIVEYLFGETPYQDLVPICSVVKHNSPKNIFEFGTFTGSTTWAISLNASIKSNIWTLDITQEERENASHLNSWNKKINYEIIGKYINKIENPSRLSQLFCNSLDFDPKPFLKTIDFIFIDASHGTPYIQNDTSKAFDMLAPGGVIMWHDYPTFPDIKKTLETLPQDIRPWRIRKTNVAIFIHDKNKKYPSLK